VNSVQDEISIPFWSDFNLIKYYVIEEKLDRISIPFWSDFNISHYCVILFFKKISIPFWSDFNMDEEGDGPGKYRDFNPILV